MKAPVEGSTWFFVDESGDPTFYDRHGNLIAGQRGCAPILLLGFIEAHQPDVIRRQVLALQQEVVNDPALQQYKSIRKTARALHAKDDVQPIRLKMFELIASMDIRAQFVVARKIERVFRNSFGGKEDRFYDHLVETLFKDMLHRHTENHIYFARRGSKERQSPLEGALLRSIERFETRWETVVNTKHRIYPQTPQGEPCLSVVDYVNWAVQRAFIRREMKYYRMIEDKVSLLVDLYDNAAYPDNWYSRRNPFDIEKTSPL
jgi:hypothetical protein